MTNVHFYLAGYFCPPSTFVYLTVCPTEVLLRLLLSGRSPFGEDCCQLLATSLSQDPHLVQREHLHIPYSKLFWELWPLPVYTYILCCFSFSNTLEASVVVPLKLTSLLLGKGLRLMATPYKFLRALSVLKWAEGHNSGETDYQ